MSLDSLRPTLFQPYRADLKIANTAPCGSAMIDMRPTPSTVIGGK